MYTRESFGAQRAAVKVVERRESRRLAAVAVGLGLGQLLFIRWADAHVVPPVRLTIEGAVFLAYAALIAGLIWRLDRRRNAARPICPSCGAILDDASTRVAAATGKCDRCGGQVIG